MNYLFKIKIYDNLKLFHSQFRITIEFSKESINKS